MPGEHPAHQVDRVQQIHCAAAWPRGFAAHLCSPGFKLLESLPVGRHCARTDRFQDPCHTSDTLSLERGGNRGTEQDNKLSAVWDMGLKPSFVVSENGFVIQSL